MSATPEQIADRLDELARNFLASAAANLKEGFPSVAKGQEVLGTAFTDAVGAIRTQAERVRVLEEAFGPLAACGKRVPDFIRDDDWYAFDDEGMDSAECKFSAGLLRRAAALKEIDELNASRGSAAERERVLTETLKEYADTYAKACVAIGRKAFTTLRRAEAANNEEIT